MQRPTGITILAILNFISVALCGLAALASFLGAGLMGVAGAQGGGDAAGFGAVLATFGAFVGVFFVIGAVISLLVGIGLWKLKNWGRILTIAFTVLGAVVLVIGLIPALTGGQVFAIVWNLIWLAIYGLILRYMFQPHVKQAFGVA